MKSPIPDYLERMLTRCHPEDTASNADYIPELAHVDPQLFAIAVATVDGQVYAAGDAAAEFTIQSISKPFVYAMAIEDRGLDDVLERIGVEPSGEAFNELSLEEGSKRPLNPMINAGAITAHSLVSGDDEAARVQRVVRGLSQFAGRELSIDVRVADSEWQTAHRNLAIGHMLRSYDILTGDPDVVVHGYVEQCAVRVTTCDLAVMATTLANGGLHPVTGEQVLSPRTARHVMSVMLSCGMYNAAGDWLTAVGIPAKSGVGGGIIGALPGQVGIATFSPPLDSHGHSARGVQVFEQLSEDMDMHLMEVPPPARGVIRYSYVADLTSLGSTRDDAPLTGACAGIARPGLEAHVYDLQGDIRFAGAERIVRQIVDEPPVPRIVVFDLVDVHALDDTAARLLFEATRRLHADGHEVWFAGFDDDALTRGRLDDEGLDLGAGVHVRLAADLDDVAAQLGAG